MIRCLKLIDSHDATSFHALCRIYSGSLQTGENVRVMGEAYSLADDEDMSVEEVESISICGGRYEIEVTSACAGNMVLIKGVDGPIKKTATITHAVGNEEATIFKAVKFNTIPVMKIAVEPLNPSELPKMVEGIRRVTKSYPMVQTRVEESGEHVLMGTGELSLDCVMNDIRNLYSDIEVKVSDPFSSFCETVLETSSIKAYASSSNAQNRLTMIAEPLDQGLPEDIEGRVMEYYEMDQGQRDNFFMNNHDWDLLSSRSIWAFGPEVNGTNILLNDTLPSEVDSFLLSEVRESVVQGFQWACREGPLCDEPVRGVKFKILDANISSG